MNGKDAEVTPVYELDAAMNEDPENAKVSLKKMLLFDGSANVLVIITHNTSLLEVLPFFPKKITDWDMEGYQANGV
jgi:hypothetical protein